MKISLGKYEMEMIHHDPKIFTIEGVLSKEECKHFIDISSDFMKRSTVSAINKDNKKTGEIDMRLSLIHI